MRSYEVFQHTARKSNADVFTIQAKATDPAANLKLAAIFVLAFLTVIAAGVMTMHPSNASQAQGVSQVETLDVSSSKSDRVQPTAKTGGCEKQTWGAWSEDCAAALTGVRKVRNVSFVTVEKQSASVNETILARYPTQN